VSIVHYGTQEKLERRLSQVGADLRLDDDPDSVEDCLDNASAEIDNCCRLKYSQAALAASEWIKMKWVDLATMFLCERRGNSAPASVRRAYDLAMEQLNKVMNGLLDIADAPKSKASVPVLSSMRIRLSPIPRMVVERSSSTGTAEGYIQRVDRLDYLDYVI
jgi:phage gp36-like protein